MLVRLRGLAAGLAAAGCTGVAAPDAAVDAPLAVAAEAVAPRSVKVSWARQEGTTIAGYRIERRDNLAGGFRTIAPLVPGASSLDRFTYFDTDVEPATYYGYRIIALTALGDASPPSNVGGTRTPPLPAISVAARTAAPNASSSDNDGFIAELRRGTDTVRTPLGTNATVHFSPLNAGRYEIALRGVAPNCALKQGTDSVRAVDVTDIGVHTVSEVRFDIVCRDPTRAHLAAIVQQSGDTLDANGLRLTVTGIASDASLPDSQRVFHAVRTATGGSAAFAFENLRPGAYDVELGDISSLCTLAGSARRSHALRALAIDTTVFSLFCEKPIVEDTVGRPIVLQHTWSPAAAAVGTRVSLTMQLDLTALGGTSVGGMQGTIRYNSTLLRYDSARVGAFDLLAPNGNTPGTFLFAAFNTGGQGLTGVFTVGRVWFTVIGAGPARVNTSTTLEEVVSAGLVDLTAKVRTREARLTIGTQQGGANQPPIAEANGDYQGPVGAPIAFSSAGSTDADGTIATYSWSFGDGGASTAPNPAHTYAAAGTYVARLTVTDNHGATATDSARVVVGSVSPNVPPVARISAPLVGAVNAPVSLSGATSSDADGSIVGYAWILGDGETASGPVVAHAFSAPGTYTIRLTVSDDKGATHSAQHVIAVTATVQTPFPWTNTFGAIGADRVVELTVTLNLSANIPDTPGQEALESWEVADLAWDPAKLQFFSLSFGQGFNQSAILSNVGSGHIALRGHLSPSNSTGVVTIAKLRFRATAGAGLATTIVQFAMVLVQLAVAVWGRPFRRYHILGRLWRADWPRCQTSRRGDPL